MKITKTDSGIKIILSYEELDSAGISISDLEKNSLSAQIFIAGLISALNRLDLTELSEDIAVTVSRTEEFIIIRLSPVSENPENKTHTYCTYEFAGSSQLTEFCKNTLRSYADRIQGCELYSYMDRYYLIVNFRYARSTISSKKELRRCTFSTIFAAKIKEYGKKLSDTPLEKIFQI